MVAIPDDGDHVEEASTQRDLPSVENSSVDEDNTADAGWSDVKQISTTDLNKNIREFFVN